jgi:hypothetical protein
MNRNMRFVLTVLLLLAVLYGLYWNIFTYLPKAYQIHNLFSGNHQVKTSEILQLLRFHPELDNYAVLTSVFPLIQQIAQYQGTESTVRSVLSEMEPYAGQINSATNPVPLEQLGGIYYTLYTEYGNQDDYLKSESYYLRFQKLKPNDGETLYDLYCLYQRAAEPQKLKETADKIRQNWHVEPSCIFSQNFGVIPLY